jgi:hypothetical protein
MRYVSANLPVLARSQRVSVDPGHRFRIHVYDTWRSGRHFTQTSLSLHLLRQGFSQVDQSLMAPHMPTPAYIEHSPRGLLAAAAHGLPIVATPECGLPPSFGAIEVQAGDVLGLIAALHRALEPARHGVETRAPCGTPC